MAVPCLTDGFLQVAPAQVDLVSVGAAPGAFIALDFIFPEMDHTEVPVVGKRALDDKQACLGRHQQTHFLSCLVAFHEGDGKVLEEGQDSFLPRLHEFLGKPMVEPHLSRNDLPASRVEALTFFLSHRLVEHASPVIGEFPGGPPGSPFFSPLDGPDHKPESQGPGQNHQAEFPRRSSSRATAAKQ